MSLAQEYQGGASQKLGVLFGGGYRGSSGIGIHRVPGIRLYRVCTYSDVLFEGCSGKQRL